MNLQPAPVAIRAVIALGGIGLLVLPGAVHPLPFALTLAGGVAAVVAPRLVGSSVVSVGFVLAWLAADGWSVSQPVTRTVIAAAVLYVVQVSTALAACAPVDARVDPVVLTGWLRRCGLPVLVAGVVIVVDEALPVRSGSSWFELAGLVGVVLVGATAVYAVRRRLTGAG